MYLIYDTETTGFPENFAAPYTDTDNWPRMVQIAWQLHDENGSLVEAKNHIIFPDGFTIPFAAQKIHGISTERAQQEGLPIKDVLEEFNQSIEKAKFVIGHNIVFDQNVTACEFHRLALPTKLLETKEICTKETTPNFTQLPGGKGKQFKWPTLSELHFKLFGEYFDEAHNAAADVEATARVFFGIVKERVIGPPDFEIPKSTFQAVDTNPAIFEVKVDIGISKSEAETKYQTRQSAAEIIKQAKQIEVDVKKPFVHLHVRSQFSVLQSTIAVNQLIDKAVSFKMPAIALTDLGNMFGAFQFVQTALQHDITPIVGVELYMVEDRHKQKFTKDLRDTRYQQPFLAKNLSGYHNIAKMSSIGYLEGYYAGFPRIDKEVITKYKNDVIALSGNIYGEIPHLILNVGEHQAEEAFKWWKSTFGDDFYVELIRHGLEEEEVINQTLLKFAKKYEVKVIATNDVYYANKEDHNAHDILLCIKDGNQQSEPIGRGRGFRYGLTKEEYYIKSQDEMKQLFADIPEAIENTFEILEKCSRYELQRDVLLPKFDIPHEFIDQEDDKDGGKRGENAYLKYLTFEGAKKRYSKITPEIQERLDFELETIAKTGYPGYFLIVQDFTRKAREMGVSVGPGRGSAAGSAVAYCTGITNVDPIKYDLLFERFLNPERVSLPDIDIDFDDEGRQLVIDYVIEKYGKNQVAQIITYGTMAAKSSIRDTGRALGLTPAEYDRLSKLVPDIKLNKLFSLNENDLATKLKNKQEDISKAKTLKDIAAGNDNDAKTIKQAVVVEGSLRNTGIHACGVIITPEDITNLIPVAVAKDANMCCTQFDNSVVESAGLLKMDFLGLKTLTLIKDAVNIIHQRQKNKDKLNPDDFPLDDSNTYELFQRGETVGIFQYESAGMQKYMKELKPTTFADLIAMNALYRPGPLEYIPSFINRKHGKEAINYDLPEMEEYLRETYGITVYQEQVMLLSQKLAGFSKGEADTLRKAMGKKKFDLIEKLKPEFLNRGAEKGHPKEILEKIWKDWEAFASYAFNKSHSTCYAWVAYQTAYLKANFPAEYMASVLSNNMGDIEKVTIFMDECQRMGLEVLGPDINESEMKFTVNANGQIRFGLGAIKGVGEAAVLSIISERIENGNYKDIFDLTKRSNLRAVNKKTLESLAVAGAFDAFGGTRSAYFYDEGDGITFLEKALKFGAKAQQDANSMQQSLFGEASDVDLPTPEMPEVPPWPSLERLNREKDLVGFFISGHPLDPFKLEIEKYCNAKLAQLHQPQNLIGKELKVAGVVASIFHAPPEDGRKPMGKLTISDYSGDYEFRFRGEDYAKFRKYFQKDWFVFLRGKFEQFKNDGFIFFKCIEMQLLSELRDKMTNEIYLALDVNNIDDSLVNELSQLIKSHPGNCKLSVRVIDSKMPKPNAVSLKSKTFHVDPNNDFIKQMEAIDAIKFRLN